MSLWLAACVLLVGGAALRTRQPDKTEELRDLVRIAVSHSKPPPDFAEYIKSRNVSAAPRTAMPVPEEREGRSRFVLHLHFNWASNYDVALWLLEREICHPRNFMLCALVSDWSGAPEAKTNLSAVQKSKRGVPVRLVDCAANGDPSFPRHHGALMYVCLGMTLRLAQEAQAEGVLMLADDAMLLTPWRKVMPYLQTLGTTVMPFASPSRAEAPSLDLRQDPKGFDMWMRRHLRERNFTLALESLSSSRQARLGFNASSMVVEKARSGGDALYVPTRQAADFQELADHFAEYRIFEEWALPVMAQLLSGEAWRPEWPMKGRSLWGRFYRRTCLTKAAELMKQGEVSFIHPVKLSRAALREKFAEWSDELIFSG